MLRLIPSCLCREVGRGDWSWIGAGPGLGLDWDGKVWAGRFVDLWGVYIDVFFNMDLFMTFGDDRTSVNVES